MQRTYWVRRLCAVISGFAAFVALPASAQLTVHLDRDGDGVYERTGVYNVTYVDAVKAFHASGGKPWDGVGPALNLQRVPGVQFNEPQSWDGFIGFLDGMYGNQFSTRTQSCDDTITIGRITWECSSNPDTCPPNPPNCVGTFTRATARLLQCLNDPPCPGTKPLCTPLVINVEITAFDTLGGTACECSPTCTINPNATVAGTGIMHQGPVCQCSVFPQGIPTVSEWGNIILGLLFVVAATVLFAVNRRAAPALAGIAVPSSAHASLFDGALLSRVALIASGVTLAALLIVGITAGELAARDAIGSMLCAAIGAYLVHLWIIIGRSRR